MGKNKNKVENKVVEQVENQTITAETASVPTETATLFNCNDETIDELLAKRKTIDNVILQEAYARIAERKKEELTKETVRIIRIVEFIRASEVLKIRKSNRLNRLAKEHIKEIESLMQAIQVEGDLKQFDKIEKMKEEYNKKIREVVTPIEELSNDLWIEYSDIVNDPIVRRLAWLFGR